MNDNEIKIYKKYGNKIVEYNEGRKKINRK